MLNRYAIHISRFFKTMNSAIRTANTVFIPIQRYEKMIELWIKHHNERTEEQRIGRV